MDAGLRKKRISLLSDIVMHMAPITIRKRLNMANMAVATFRSAGEGGDSLTQPQLGHFQFSNFQLSPDLLGPATNHKKITNFTKKKTQTRNAHV